MVAVSRPRIAIVCRGCGEDGSVARVALRHAEGLAETFDVVLLSDSFPDVILPGVAFQRVRARRFTALRRFGHVPGELSFVRSAVRELVRLRPDFVIAHAHAIAAHAAARMSGVPLALVTHGDIFERPRGTFDPLVERYYRFVEPVACRRATVVLAIAPSLADAAVRNGARRENVLVLPNGIDLEQYELRTPSADDSRPLRILFMGRLAVEKGVDLLLDACNVLRREGILFHLDVVGGGVLEAQLRAHAAAADLGDCVTFHGHQPHAGTHRFFRYADVVCVPSRSEPQGLIVLEALASGLPVIGSDVGGIPTMVQHEQNGLLVQPTVTSLAEALRHVAKHREQLRSLAAAARPSVESFSWRKIVPRLAAIIGERLGSAVDRFDAR